MVHPTKVGNKFITLMARTEKSAFLYFLWSAKRTKTKFNGVSRFVII